MHCSLAGKKVRLVFLRSNVEENKTLESYYERSKNERQSVMTFWFLGLIDIHLKIPLLPGAAYLSGTSILLQQGKENQSEVREEFFGS